MSSSDSIHVIGATGRSGQALCRALRQAGRPFTPVVRDGEKWRALGIGPAPRLADLDDASALRAALAGAGSIVSAAHARHVPAVLAAAPAEARFVFLGSTRLHTRWPDAHGEGVKAGETAFLASGRPGVILHPTMIYGAQGEDNVQRLAKLLRRLPILPLPDGGRALVQPIHQDDVTACILAALAVDWRKPDSVIVAGPEAMAYRDFVGAIAAAAALPPPRILPAPISILAGLAPLTRMLPFLPRVRAAEIRRLGEDKAFSIGAMRERLGVSPRPLPAGLAATPL